MKTENIISVLLGIALSIPICITAHNDRATRTEEYCKFIPVIVDTSDLPLIESTETEEVTEETTEEWVDGGYDDKVYLDNFKITAYCACSKCCGKWADGYTATGTIATEGRTIAVDPDVIPLGSIVNIDGNNYVAEDVGGAIKENRVDIFFKSHQDALNWGVQYHDVYLVEERID